MTSPLLLKQIQINQQSSNYIPKSIQRILENNKKAFVKQIDLEITQDEIKQVLEEHVGYLGAGFDYFSKGYVHTSDQNEIKADQDRTPRALSNALFTFSLALLQTGEKPQILQQNDEKIIYFLKSRARFVDRPDQKL